MNYTVKIYYRNALAYVLSNTSGDPTVHDVIRRTIRETLRSWRKNYPAIVKDFEVHVGYLTEVRSEFPGDNGGGQIVGTHHPMIVAVFQSVIGAVAAALDEMYEAEETEDDNIIPNGDDPDSWIKRHEDNPHDTHWEDMEPFHDLD